MISVSAENGPNNPIEIGLEVIEPGLYSLSNGAGVRPVKLSKEYQHYMRRIAARGNLVDYLLEVLNHRGNP